MKKDFKDSCKGIIEKTIRETPDIVSLINKSVYSSRVNLIARIEKLRMNPVKLDQEINRNDLDVREKLFLIAVKSMHI